jgi:formylglycine-generating enzyme required for sulfatase activity
LRGGDWVNFAVGARCAGRSVSFDPYYGYYDVGFRCVRGL